MKNFLSWIENNAIQVIEGGIRKILDPSDMQQHKQYRYLSHYYWFFI